MLHPRVHEARFDHNLEPSTWWYKDASFLRLKNVEFSYLMDKKAAQRVMADRIRLVPFWQLYLYLVHIEKQEHFYHDLYEQYK